jgi:hypothetical protein
MKILCRALCVALIAVPMYASAADEIGCDAVNWGEEVLAKFPNAEKACHDVTTKNGAAYAHYVAEVVAASSESVTVHLLDKKGKGISEVKFVPAADQKVKLAGKETKYADLEKGTKLDLYIEHSKWGLYASPDGSAMKILSRTDL